MNWRLVVYVNLDIYCSSLFILVDLRIVIWSKMSFAFMIPTLVFAIWNSKYSQLPPFERLYTSCTMFEVAGIYLNMDPGPIDPRVLHGQDHHRSRLVWTNNLADEVCNTYFDIYICTYVLWILIGCFYCRSLTRYDVVGGSMRCTHCHLIRGSSHIYSRQGFMGHVSQDISSSIGLLLQLWSSDGGRRLIRFIYRLERRPLHYRTSRSC